MKLAIATCVHCGNEFRYEYRPAQARLYCSRECRNEHLGENRRERPGCRACGGPIDGTDHSRCRRCDAARRMVERGGPFVAPAGVACEHCGAEIPPARYGKGSVVPKFCRDACKSAAWRARRKAAT